MGRGRNGPIDQSIKKPKISKNKVRGGNLEMFHPHYKQEHHDPLFLSEGLLAEMKKMSPQNLMNILLPNNVNRNISYSFKKKRQPCYIGRKSEMVVRNALTVTEAIKRLPPELREKTFKHYLAMKIWERNEMGWNKIHGQLMEGPFCDKQGMFSKIFICSKCNECERTGLCVLCLKNNVQHYLVEDRWDVNDFEEKFLKWW